MENKANEHENNPFPPHQVAAMVAESAARKIVIEHINLCPFASSQIDQRLRNLETSFARLTGFMLGSGLLGGAAGAAVTRLLTP